MKSLKSNKAPGIDNITAEVLKPAIRFATDWLYDLFHKIWIAETIPEDWCRELIIELPKKGDRTMQIRVFPLRLQSSFCQGVFDNILVHFNFPCLTFGSGNKTIRM